MPKIFSQAQLSLPVGLTSDRKLVSLQQYLDGTSGVRLLPSLDEKEQARVAIERIRSNPEFEMTGISVGDVSPERAVSEITSHTDLGHLLVEIEKRTVDRLLEDAAR